MAGTSEDTTKTMHSHTLQGGAVCQLSAVSSKKTISGGLGSFPHRSLHTQGRMSFLAAQQVCFKSECSSIQARNLPGLLTPGFPTGHASSLPLYTQSQILPRSNRRKPRPLLFIEGLTKNLKPYQSTKR